MSTSGNTLQPLFYLPSRMIYPLFLIVQTKILQHPKTYIDIPCCYSIKQGAARKQHWVTKLPPLRLESYSSLWQWGRFHNSFWQTHSTCIRTTWMNLMLNNNHMLPFGLLHKNWLLQFYGNSRRFYYPHKLIAKSLFLLYFLFENKISF